MFVIPVIIGTFALGGGFDFFNFEPKKFPIFDHNAVQENVEYTEMRTAESSYFVAESTQEALGFLNIEPTIGLKVISGDVGIQGYGKYLANVVDRSKTIDIIVSYKIVNGIESLSPSLKPLSGWHKKSQRQVGTHFINSIEYGGHLFVSVQFKPTRSEDAEEVRAAVRNSLAKTGSLDSTLFEQLEDVYNELKEKVILTMSVYASAGHVSPPTQLSDLKHMFEEFPAQIERINGGKGWPLRLYLEDLHTLESKFPEFKVSMEVRNLLEEIEEKYVDLRVATNEFKTWTSKGGIWTPEQDQKVDKYLEQLKRALRAFNRAISTLDITGSTSQFDKALRAYNYDGQERFNRFTRELRVLIKSIDGNSLYQSVYSSLLAIQREDRPY